MTTTPRKLSATTPRKLSATTHRAIAAVLTEQMDLLTEDLEVYADSTDPWGEGRAAAIRSARRQLEIERDHHVRLAEIEAKGARFNRDRRKGAR